MTKKINNKKPFKICQNLGKMNKKNKQTIRMGSCLTIEYSVHHKTIKTLKSTRLITKYILVLVMPIRYIGCFM